MKYELPKTAAIGGIDNRAFGMDKKNAPFYHAIKDLAKLTTRFFMPGHKGNPAAIPEMAALLNSDITEIPGADDLSNPTGPLKESEWNMTRAFGSGATLYSTSGSTSCIEAMLTLFVAPGSPVILARDCHASAVRALAFLDACPLWVLPDEKGQFCLPAFKDALAKNPGAPIYVTSPGYYGQMADIPELVALCKENGVPLLVDNAHGAYLKFLPESLHPISLGADACADSAHKTLPCLTPASLLHLKDPGLAVAARKALNLYSSTSPSYLVLQSLDLAAGMLLVSPPDFTSVAKQVVEIRNKFPHIIEPCDDPLRLCLYPAKGGWPAKIIQDALAKAEIYPELSDGQRIVLMVSPYNTKADFSLLAETLAAFPLKKPIVVKDISRELPPVVCSIRQALFGPKENIPVEKAIGRTCADIQAPCPPGIPTVLPGEIITKQDAAILLTGGIFQVDVVK